jgi:hypothetical protein
VNSLVGLNEFDAIPFNLFPNPSTGEFNITLNNESNTLYNVEVMDIDGRVVYQGIISGASHLFDLSDKANGSYIVRIANDEIQSVKRIVVKK